MCYTGNIVIINSAKTEDSGEYKCIASNGLTTHEDKISVLVTGDHMFTY